jgi:hypothetical protein
MRNHRYALLILLAAVLSPLAALQARSDCPVDLRCTDDARIAHAEAMSLAEREGTDSVLVVFDIDDTLLTMDQELGSHAWFTWQQELLDRDPASHALVAGNFGGLLAAQDLLYTLSRMHPPQPDLPALVEDLQNRGIRLIALTSRGHDLRDATRRELLRNGYDLGRNPIAPRPGFVGDDPYLPYQPGNLAARGLTGEGAARFGLGSPRPVSYRNGIYLTAGQHKGAMLRSLLARTGRDFRAIVFLDDSEEKVRDMIDAFPPASGRELKALVYTRAAPLAAAFSSATARTAAISAWNRLAATLVEVFPSRRGLVPSLSGANPGEP